MKTDEAMKYTSSPLTFIFKYIFPPIMLAGGIIGFLTLNNSNDEVMSNFSNAFGIAMIWVSIFLIQMPFRVKNVEVDENGLSIRSRNGSKVIPFKNIKTISLLDFTNPWMITVKYKDINKDQTNKISYMPNPKYQRIMNLDEMTEYITKKAKEQNDDFEESSTVKNLAILFLAGSPFLIGMIYYMSNTGFQ